MSQDEIDKILDELKEQERACSDLSLRIIKARLDHDKKAEMETWIDMESQIVRNTQIFSFLTNYLYDLKVKGVIK